MPALKSEEPGCHPPGSTPLPYTVCGDRELSTLKRRSVHTLFGTGYTHGASRVNVTIYFSVLFCVHLQIDIQCHVSLNRDVGNTTGLGC